MAMRKIIHIDMDAFYASVEQRDFPEYRGIPIAVGGSPEGRGVVTTASYEARIYGVKSAMSSREALQLCSHLTFVPPRFDVYRAVSQEIREIFRRYTDLIEPLSLDEAFLDVTTDKKNIGYALEIAEKIRMAIRQELKLTASAGVSVNKFLAKIASDMDKPDGLTFIGPSKITAFMEELPIEKFFGVGKVTAQKMRSIGIFKGKDLKKYRVDELVSKFGKSGRFFYDIVRGIDDRPVRVNRPNKSIGVEDTFSKDIENVDILKQELKKLCVKVERRLLAKQQKGRTVTLKIKFSDFSVITRSQTHEQYLYKAEDILSVVTFLLRREGELRQKVRLLGITVSNFYDAEFDRQLKLFTY